ncbi:MAG: histidinol-phosphatase HisJ family protein [Oscillospiraceae bacterium]|nr:histidinol-phosphatase HisJ family protein [Oscillospiraceae bacterium]
MMESNYHTHTTFCDGADSPEELVAEAIRLGCPEIGFSGHSYLKEDGPYCMSEQGTFEYCREIRALQEKYRNRITIRLGIEQDIFSRIDLSLFDYVIGAVHYVEKEGKKYAVDESREGFCTLLYEIYGGDAYALAEDYYALVAKVYEKTHCDIIAHFDLITKYNEEGHYFDVSHPRYRAAADAALEELLKTPCLLEVNTGAMARGYRTQPYPEKRILERWLSAGKELIFSSDCHDKRALLYGFDALASLPHRSRL